MKALAIVLAIIFIVLAILTFTGVAHFAPFLGLDGTHHTKHAVLYLVLALLSLIWLRFQK
jgi:hypothetical protein